MVGESKWSGGVQTDLLTSFLISYLETMNKEKRNSKRGLEGANKILNKIGGLFLEANGGEGCFSCIIDVSVQVGAVWFSPERSLFERVCAVVVVAFGEWSLH